jgi:hypothetical protein
LQVGLLVASEAILRHGHPSSFCCQAWGPLARQLLCADPPLAPAQLAGRVSSEALAALTGQAAALVEGCLAVGVRCWAWRPALCAVRCVLPGARQLRELQGFAWPAVRQQRLTPKVRASLPAPPAPAQADATVLATLLCPPEQQASRDCIYRPPSGSLVAEAPCPHEQACQRAQQAAPWCSCSPALWQALAGCRHPTASAALLGAAAHLAMLEPQGTDPSAAANQQHAGEAARGGA